MGKTYLDLLGLAADTCESCSLVWQDQLVFDDSATELAGALGPLLIREDRTSEWPGTSLLGGRATIRHYRLIGSTLFALGRAPSLYAWQAPERPEDLAFYTGDGSVWLASIAHERVAWFEAGPDLEILLRARAPGLVFRSGQTPRLIWNELDRKMVEWYTISTMPLNIKNPEVERLVKEVADMTGESKTEAVRQALLERRRRLAFRDGRTDRREEIGRFLEREVWSRIPEDQLGDAPQGAEVEEILGFGSAGH